MHGSLAKRNTKCLLGRVDFLGFKADCPSVTKARKVQVRAYIGPEEQESLRSITSRTGLTESWVMTQIAVSALRAIRANGGEFPLPLQLELSGKTTAKPGKK